MGKSLDLLDKLLLYWHALDSIKIDSTTNGGESSSSERFLVLLQLYSMWPFMQRKPFQGLAGSLGLAMNSLQEYLSNMVPSGRLRRTIKTWINIQNPPTLPGQCPEFFFNTLICYHPNKHLLSTQQSIFPFPGGQEPMPRPAPAAGSGCSAPGSPSREWSQQGWAGPRPLRGVNAHMLGHVQQFPLSAAASAPDWLISQDKLLGILMHKPRCLLIIWRYLFLPCSLSQREQGSRLWTVTWQMGFFKTVI